MLKKMTKMQKIRNYHMLYHYYTRHMVEVNDYYVSRMFDIYRFRLRLIEFIIFGRGVEVSGE